MMCMHNHMTKMTKTTKMTKIQDKMTNVTIMMTEMITRTHAKLESNPDH